MFFASTVFLAGLALLSVPWWLHRLNAHAADQHRFSSLFLMRPSETPVNMRRKLQHLFLLALRWLLLTAACLAFAEPFIELAGEPRAANAPLAHQIIVVDTSLSMQRTNNGVTAIDTAKQQARNLVTGLPADAKAAIISAADQLQLMAPLTADRAQLNAAIGALQAGAARLSVNGLVGRINTLGDTLATPGEQLHVHLISDFQGSAMPDQFNALIEGSVWPLTLHAAPAPEGNDGNWAISGMRFVTDTNAAAPALAVSVRGFATDAATLALTLQQNDNPVGTQDILVPANSSATAHFELPPAGRGATAWTVELTVNDALAADNIRRQVRDDAGTVALPVLSDNDRAFAYLNAAVQAAAPRFIAERVSALAAPAVPVIALIDPGVLPDATLRVLTRYLEAGGGILMTAGPTSRAAGRLPLLNMPLASNRFEQASRGAVATDRSHPALAGFGAWQDLSFFQAVRAADDFTGTGEVILNLDDGTPLLVEHRVGAGRLMLLTTAFDPAWSSLVVRPAFVGFMANLLGYLAEDLLPVEALVGQPFAIPAQSVQLFDATGERVLGLAATIDRPTVSLAAPGIYELRTPSSTRRLAVNTDLRESNLTPAPAALLERWQASSSPTGARTVPESNPNNEFMPGEAESPRHSVALAPWLLALLALLVFIEPLLANTGVLQRNNKQAALT